MAVVGLPGRVLEIRCAEDWLRLCRAHPLEVSASRRHDWYRTTGMVGPWVIPDWSTVAQEADASTSQPSPTWSSPDARRRWATADGR